MAKYYNLDQLLEASKKFENQPGGNDDLEVLLRTIESESSSISKESVKQVSEDTFIEGISRMTHCVHQVITSILGEFARLGYKCEEKEV